MRALRELCGIVSVVLVGLGAVVCAGVQHGPHEAGPASPPVPTDPRFRVFVSDLHFGPGRLEGAGWDPIEDFRWTKALAGFLKYVSQQGEKHADLVILGDLMELWQHPRKPCASSKPDWGCTPQEMAGIVDRVLAEHDADIRELWKFAAEGSNQIIVVPGNHDAALLADQVWRKFMAVGGGAPASVKRADGGVWMDPDRYISAEHGHQIGVDVSGYGSAWPRAFRDAATKTYPRPWGQLFVESFFDRVEVDCPIIDNIIPQGNGVSLYLKTRGVGGSAGIIGKFLAFNVLKTSLSQKIVLDIPAPEDARKSPTHGWDLDIARGFGYRLFADALPEGDWFRDMLLTDQAGEWTAVRTDLTALARDKDALPVPEVVALCDRIAFLKQQEPQVTARKTCSPSTLALSAIASFSSDETILRPHLAALARKNPTIGLFIYGHTHQMAKPFPVDLGTGRSMTVVNTGAFQRLVDQKTVERWLEQESPAQVLAKKPESIPPCYSFVQVTEKDGQVTPELKYWLQAEDSASGELLDPCDSRCPKLERGCKQAPR